MAIKCISLEGGPPGSKSQPCYPPAEWERLDRLAVDVSESSEKIKRNGAAGRGHSLGTSLEDRPGHRAHSSSLSSAKQLVSPIQPKRYLISFSGTSFKKNHILQSCPTAQRPTNTHCVIFLYNPPRFYPR